MWSWFKFNNLRLALGTNLKFYTSVAKRLKLKVRKFKGLIPTFVEVTGEKLVGRGALFGPPFRIGLTTFVFNDLYKIALQKRCDENQTIFLISV